MKYGIAFSSMTGNTAAVAEQLRALLPAESCAYFGELTKECLGLDVDFWFVGFWTDKGSCDDKTRVFLKKLNKKTVSLFGTAGFGSSPEYFSMVLKYAEANIPVSNTVLPGFMCQGKMKPTVKEKYTAILAEKPNDSMAKKILEEYESAMNHPNEDDFKRLAVWAGKFEA